jgi:ketosteroid isomerase-like protein
LIDAGDQVIASTVLHGHGSASGADVNDAYVFVYKLRDGLIVEGWEYRTKEEALEALEALSSEDRQLPAARVGTVQRAKELIAIGVSF